MFELVNRDRQNPLNVPETRGHAQPLVWNDQLAEVARAHSGDMARRGFVAHLSPEGVSPDMRVTAAGIDWQSEGENIAFYRGVAAAQTAFMNEPRFAANHRANILDPKFTEVGIGIVEGPGGRYYITQEFIERLRTGASPSLTPVPLQRAPPTQTGSEPAASPPSTCVSR